MAISVQFSPDETRCSVTNLRQTVPSNAPPSWEQVTRPNFYRPVCPSWSYVGNTRCCSLAGNDTTGDGLSPATAWRSIAKLVEWLTVAGRIGYIMPGEYTEVVPNITASGVPGSPIVLSCAPAAFGGGLGTVRITRPPDDVVARPWRSVITLVNARHVTINGLELVGALNMPGNVAGQNGIELNSSAGQGCRFTNNIIHSNTHCGIKEVGHGGNGFTCSGNIVLNNGRNPVDHGIYISSNDSSGVVIDGDIYLDNYGAGVHCYGDDGGPDDVVVRRVLSVGNRINFLQSGARGRWELLTGVGGYAGFMYYNAGCFDNSVTRSIFSASSAFCQVNSGPVGLNVEDYNCNWGASLDGVLPGNHSQRADPKFRDPATGDFRLAADSLCPMAGCFAPEDSMSTGSRTYPWTVAAAPVQLNILPATWPGFTVGVPVSVQLSASPGTGPFSFALTSGTLPAGVTLSLGGLLSGTPTTAGSGSATIGVVGP